jgi:hypothetical protein
MTNQDLEKPRTILEAIDYIREIRNKSNSEEKKNIRIKQGVYRKYQQEYIPMFFYALSSYNIYKNIKISANTNNDNFDGLILDENNEVIEKIEISFPIEGSREHEEAAQLNKDGVTNIYHFSTDEANKYLELVFLKAKEKSKKDYTNNTIVITLELWPYFSLDDIDDLVKIYNLRDRLKKLSYHAKKVVLFIPPHNSSEIKTLGLLLDIYKSET